MREIHAYQSAKSFLELTPEELLGEVKVRRELIKGMIGQLYPSILTDEIETLLARRLEILAK